MDPGSLSLSSPRRIIVGGIAKMPADTGTRYVYDVLAVSVIVDATTNVVIHASASFVTESAQLWTKAALIGQDLFEEPAAFLALVERDYWGRAQGALTQCYREIVRRYRAGLASQ